MVYTERTFLSIAERGAMTGDIELAMTAEGIAVTITTADGTYVTRVIGAEELAAMACYALRPN